MTRRMGHPIRHYMEAALGIVSSIWLGLLIGVSFIATPVKFSAPTLALEPALDVGRVTFDLFSKVEWGVATLLLLTVVLAGFRPWRTAAAGVLVAALGIQAIWLLPASTSS